MKKKKIIRLSMVIVGLGAIIFGGIGFYLYNMPHRDIQATKTDYRIEASSLVDEYLSDPQKANEKYLDTEGKSKVLEVTGTLPPSVKILTTKRWYY